MQPYALYITHADKPGLRQKTKKNKGGTDTFAGDTVQIFPSRAFSVSKTLLTLVPWYFLVS